MKNLMLLITLVCILFTSCSTEDVNTLNVEQKIEAAYVFKLTNTNTWEAEIITDLIDRSNVSNNRKNDNSLHAHGDFSGFGGGLISFSGTQNNGGAHGSATLEVTFGPFGTANVVLETVSVVSIGDNEVVYGGLISEVIENSVMFPPPPPGAPTPLCDPYELGTYVNFVVKDNGQGNNAPSDQYKGLIFNNCFEPANGGATLPWFFAGFFDVENPLDEIKVND